MDRVETSVGILTFHCSDNYGAMLQAYGLKTYLCRNGIQADIIRYEPFFMTGRHWLFPYIPVWSNGIAAGLYGMLGSFKVHLEIGKDFFVRKANMRYFRRQYLIDRKQVPIHFSRGLRNLLYPYYVVGSDQIWNPEITYRMRKAYFGAFESRREKRVISYAASLGGADLSERYNEEFSRLIQYVDAVSVREEDAVSYVRRFYQGEVAAVGDPVFFLEKEVWQKLEKAPERAEYILVYITEPNQELSNYARKLAQEKGLSVVEISAGRLTTGGEFEVDFTAGPAEFLGYIHRAEYVVSNSFHAVAFSIIFQKRFMAFVHSNRGARIRNILKIHGLMDRLYGEEPAIEIDAYVDWRQIGLKTKAFMAKSSEFLLGNLRDEP